MAFLFGEFRLDNQTRELSGPDGVVAMEPQVFDVLGYLITHRNRVVPKAELLDEIWGDRFVSVSALSSRIRSARQAVHDDGRTQGVIRTAHGVGFRFVADVQEVVDEAHSDLDRSVERTFLVTDIEGSSALWERDAEAMAETLRLHDEIVIATVRGFDGAMFKHVGDGICSAFDAPGSATQAALAAQAALQAASWPSDRPKVRIGIHAGLAVARSGDYFGKAVNRAARVTALARGDQILATRTVADEVGGLVGRSDLGWFQLIDGAPAEAVVLLDGPPGSKGARSLHAGRPVTAPASALVGRDHILDEIVDHLNERPMVSLIGPGGVGKTALARHAAHRAIQQHKTQGWFCELADVQESAAVAEHVLVSIGGSQRIGETAATSVVSNLRHRSGFLVLDNCEHVRKAVADLCWSLLPNAHDVTVLVTSRRRLNVIGDRVVPVEPLTSEHATRFFVESAASLGADVEDGATLRRICDRLDNLPLAIELAAARAPYVSLPDLEQLLEDRFALLGGSEHGPDHHSTLEQAIAWSVDALEPQQRATLEALSAFNGPFGLDAVRAVAQGANQRSAVTDTLELCEASLIASDASAPDSRRYRLLDSTREYVAARAPDLEEAQQLHLAYYTEVVERANLSARNSAKDHSVHSLRDAWENIRAAFDHAARVGDRIAMLRLARGTHVIAELMQRFEVIGWCERALAGDRYGLPTDLVRDTLALWARLLAYRTDFQGALELSAEAEALGASFSTRVARFWALWTTADLAGAAAESNELVTTTANQGGLEEASALFLRHMIGAVGDPPAPELALRLDELGSEGEIAAMFALLGEALRGIGTTDTGDLLALLWEVRDRASAADLEALWGATTTFAMAAVMMDDDRKRAVRTVATTMRDYTTAGGAWAMIAADLGGAALLLLEHGAVAEATVLFGAIDALGFRGGISTGLITEGSERARKIIGNEYEPNHATGAAMAAPEAALYASEALEGLLDGQRGRSRPNT